LANKRAKKCSRKIWWNGRQPSSSEKGKKKKKKNKQTYIQVLYRKKAFGKTSR